ncbi:MAG: hypothetical protein LBI74_08245, partial [Synergistaceae bacterium]|nr:hypothetical protein [Synergistaceae bacterium]
MRRRSLSFKARLFLVSILILLTRNESCAITRAEALDALFSELGYVEMNNPAPPEDVSRTHPFAGVIGSSARRGLIPRSAFSPDETIDRRGAVELALSMIGWRFETLLSKSLDLSPDAEGSLDYIFRLASEMSPPAPKRLLSDGAAPLSAEDKTSLLAWIRNCKDGVIWKKTVSFKDADLTIYRQGVALPNVSYSSFGGGAVGPGSGGPLYIAALSASPASMAARITFAGTAGKDMAPLSEMVRADGAAGGVNGGFFSKDHPVGATLFKGMHTGRPIKGRPAVGWNNEGRFMAFGDGSARVGIRTPVRFIPFKNFNTAPSENENSLFTPGAIGTLPEIAADAARITVRDGVVAERAESPSDCRAIPADSLLIVARGRS